MTNGNIGSGDSGWMKNGMFSCGTWVAIKPVMSYWRTKYNSYLASSLLLSFFLFSPCLLADSKLSGNVAVAVDSKNKNNTDVDVIAELKFKTQRVRGFKAHIEGEGAAVKRDVHLEDVYIDYKISKRLHASFGYNKKVLGMEYENGKKKRLTVHRSPMYKKMESLGLVGRQLNLRVHWRLGKKKTGTFLSGALGGDNSRDYNGQVSVQRKFKNGGVGAWGLVESHRIDNDSIVVFAEVLAAWYRSRHGRMALELFHGVDAQRTEFQQHLGHDRTVHYAGPKFDFAMHLPLGEQCVVSPLFQVSFIVDDMAIPHENTLHFLAGIHFDWNGLVIAFNAETFGVKDVSETNERHFNRRSYYGQVIYFF